MPQTPDPAEAGSFELDFVDCTCPHCRAALSFVRPQAGTVQQCPQCSESVLVPARGEAMGAKLPLPVIMPKLRLRPLRDGDAEDLVEALHGDGEVMEEHKADTAEMVEREKLVRLGQPGHGLTLGIELAETGRLIGYVWMFFTSTDNHQAEFAETMSEACLKQGYGVEVVRGVLGFCFQGLRLHRVVCRTIVNPAENTHEARVQMLEQAGMRCEGEFIKNELVRGEWVNTVWHAMLGEDFKG